MEYLTEILVGVGLGIAGWIGGRVHIATGQLKELHAWHAPNSYGRQTWKSDLEVHERILDRLEHMSEAIHELAIEIKRSNGKAK